MTAVLTIFSTGVLSIAFLVVLVVFGAAVLVALVDPMTPPETYDDPDDPDDQPIPDDLAGTAPYLPRNTYSGPVPRQWVDGKQREDAS